MVYHHNKTFLQTLPEGCRLAQRASVKALAFRVVAVQKIDVGQGVGYSDDLSLTVLTKLLNSAQFKQAKLAK